VVDLQLPVVLQDMHMHRRIGKKENRHQDQKKRLMKGKGDNTPNHGWSALPACLERMGQPKGGLPLN